jgi:4-hydroxymandelate oxidase
VEARVDFSDLEEQARERLSRDVYDYVAGGSGDEQTMADNVAAWTRMRMRPRMLRGVGTVSTRTTALGTELPTPIMVAPCAGMKLVHPEGEAAVAQGAHAAGSLYAVSLRATLRPSEIAAGAPAGVRWFQVYILADRGKTKELTLEAVEHGYQAIVFTADTPVLGDRRRDARNRFHRPQGIFKRSADLRQDADINFDDINWLHELTGLPVLVKGVVRDDDAVACLDAGAVGVIVSNHGGRQLDGCIAAADALGEVAAAVGDRGEVYVDGGIRGGADVVRALALGARGAFVGRPVIWGLATEGAEGVEGVLTGMHDELVLAMQLSGVRSIEEITPDLLVTP